VLGSVFFSIKLLANLNKKLAKLIKFVVEKTKISRNFPISLSKNNEIIPKKNHWC
jgi:hypothetical protein